MNSDFHISFDGCRSRIWLWPCSEIIFVTYPNFYGILTPGPLMFNFASIAPLSHLEPPPPCKVAEIAYRYWIICGSDFGGRNGAGNTRVS